MSDSDDIVQFPVPKKFLGIVIQALAKAMEHEPQGEPEAEKESGENSAIDWTQLSNMRKLRKGLKLRIALTLLDMAAAKPGQMIPFKEVYEEAGFESTVSARCSLGAFTKVIKREFGVPYDKAVWPVEHHWGVHADSQYYYRMPSAVAQAWIQSGK